MANVCEHCGAENLEIDVKCTDCGKPLMSTGVHRMIGNVVLDQYEINDVLGQGGMSVVYKARHQLTDQEVALKILPRELAAHSQVKSRFLEEARALAQLDHHNIVHLYTFGENDGCLVLAMQFVAGQTWEEIILSQDRMPWQEAVKISLDVLKALEYAHSRGIVHRDMKPSNVLVRADTGAATVMDFGIAKMTTSTRLTATGQTMGTVRYMSPEQVRGKDVDARTDIYSLGATLYEAVVGDTPFDGETHFEIMTKHLNEVPPPPSEHGVDLPPGLERIILKALLKRKEDRFQTAFLFRKALEAVVAGREPSLDGSRDQPAAPHRHVPTADPHAETSLVDAPAESPLTGIASTLEPAVSTGDIDVPRLKRGGPVLWIVLALIVLGAGVGVFFGMRGGDESSATPVAAPPDAGPSGPPQPFVVDGITVAIDQPYEAANLRVLSVQKRDPEPIAEAVRQARERFLAFLEERDAAEGVSVQYVNVVVVPAHVFCDRRLYENDQAYEGCEKNESLYRAHERTLYLADNERMLDVNLPSEIALQMCVDAGDNTPFAAVFGEFERQLYGGGGVKPKKKRSR
jgi:serine/threonine-protein kinase